MVKLIPHYIIPKSQANHPLIAALVEKGEFDFEDPSNIVQIACELHNIIPKKFADDPVIVLLSKHGLFEFDSEKNIVYLPIDATVAYKLGMSPYSSEPPDSYLEVIATFLKRARETDGFALARDGDDGALKYVEKIVSDFQLAAADALRTSKLLIAEPIA
jgi:hypothetical protein